MVDGSLATDKNQELLKHLPVDEINPLAASLLVEAKTAWRADSCRKMHQDGQHVTLCRLPKAEAAAEREARRLSKDRAGRRRGDSASPLSGTDGSTNRFRRDQMQERQQAEAMRIESERLAAARSQAQAQRNPNVPPNVPPPPPILETSSDLKPPGTLSVGNPGTYDWNTTEATADYANNQRRRAQAKQAREAKRV